MLLLKFGDIFKVKGPPLTQSAKHNRFSIPPTKKSATFQIEVTLVA